MPATARCPAHPEAALRPAVEGAEDLYFGLGGRYDYVACSECGAWILSPPPPEERVAAARRAYHPPRLLAALRARAARGRRVGLSGRVRARGVVRQLRRLGVPLSGGEELLDAGAGLGGFLAGMRELGGLRVRGLEANLELCRFAGDVHNVEVDHGGLEPGRYPEARFDLVSAWHLLEHEPEPGVILSELFRVTKPGGHLVVETPTLGTIAEWFGARWGQLQPPARLQHFRPSTLLALIHRAGFEILSVRRPWLPGEFASSLLLALGRRGVAGEPPSPQRRLGWGLVFALTLLIDLPLTFALTLTRSTGLVRVYARRPVVESRGA